MGGLADGQAVIGRPEVERVALGLALGIEAAEHALAQVDRERPVPIARRVVQRARSTTLRPGASQGIEVTEVLEDFLDRQLAAKCGDVQRSMFVMLGVRAPGELAWSIDVAVGCLTLLSPEFAGLDQLPIALGVDHPMHDVPAVAVEDAAQMIEGAADVQVAEIDVPVTVRTAGPMEALPFPFVGRRRPPQPIGRLQQPIDRGRAGRRHVVVEHHERQPSIALQGVFTLVVEDGSLLRLREPVVAGNLRVVLVDLAVTLPPVVVPKFFF